MITLRTNYWLYIMTAFSLTILLTSAGAFFAYGSPSLSGIFLKGSTPYGAPYEDWITKWWQWNIQIPKGEHPQLLGSALKECPVGDSGNVSFLTQSLQGKTEYSCTIPAGHAIMIPISTGECTSDEAQSTVPEDLFRCATEGDKYLTFDVKVDDVRLLSSTQPLDGFDEQTYARSKIFNMTVPEDNFLDSKPGQWKTGAGGYFAFLKPLPVGDHTVTISARVINPFDPSYNYDYNTRYLLNVQ